MFPVIGGKNTGSGKTQPVVVENCMATEGSPLFGKVCGVEETCRKEGPSCISCARLKDKLENCVSGQHHHCSGLCLNSVGGVKQESPLFLASAFLPRK